MTTFTIGCDPEIFLVSKEGQETVPVSAHGVIPGTKEKPFSVKDGAYQVDGMAVEFNTDPVQLYNGEDIFRHKKDRAFEEFNSKVVSVMGQLSAAVRETNPNYGFNISPVQEFPAEYLEKQPDEAKELGCNPDFNAYTLEQNPRPEGEAVNFRTASGHIHVGWGADIPVDHPDHLQICADFVKTADLCIGLYMTILDPEPRRRTLYGCAGAFRPKPYGVEYRTPSNVWINDKETRKAVFELVRVTIECQQRGYSVSSFVPVYNMDDVRTVINKGDYFKAFEILRAVIRNRRGAGSSLANHIKNVFENRCKLEGKTDEFLKLYPKKDAKKKDSALDDMKWYSTSITAALNG